MSENEFENYEIVQHQEVEIAQALRDVPCGDRWDDEIIATVEARGAECVIDGRSIRITTGTGEPLNFIKSGRVIVPEIDVIAQEYAEKVQSELANGLAKEFQGLICYEVSEKDWYVFKGVWRKDKLNRAEWLIQQRIEQIRLTVQPRNAESRRQRNEMAKANFVQSVIILMRRNPNLTNNLEFFDTDDMLLGCPEGYIDLNTGQVMPPDPTKLITKSVKVMPAKKAECPLFIKTLEESHKGQAEMIPYLQKLAGLCLTGIMSDEVLHYMTGSGGNGKGVFLDPLIEALGDYAGTAQEDAFTVSKSGNKGHDQVIASLRGLRMILLSEPEEGRHWGIDRLKRWTGNEGSIRANFMRKDGFEFRPTGKLIVVANHDIVINSVNPAIKRRMRKMIWPNKPEKRNEKLKNDIKGKELSGILRWAMDGLKEYLKSGFEPPDKVITATSEYMDEQDYISRFIEDCLTITEEANTLKVGTDVQPIYDEWARRNDQPPIKRGLAKKLKDAGVPSGKTGSIGNTLTHATLSGGGAIIKEDLRRLKEAEEAKLRENGQLVPLRGET